MKFDVSCIFSVSMKPHMFHYTKLRKPCTFHQLSCGLKFLSWIINSKHLRDCLLAWDTKYNKKHNTIIKINARTNNQNRFTSWRQHRHNWYCTVLHKRNWYTWIQSQSFKFCAPVRGLPLEKWSGWYWYQDKFTSISVFSSPSTLNVCEIK